VATGSAVFLDTSIQIARFFRSKDMKNRIENRLKAYNFRVSSLVVRQEFKRRVLKAAVYLLKQLEERQSYERVRRHVQEVLPPQQQRNQKICVLLLTTIDETDDDRDRTERAKLSLRFLIKYGLDDFDDSLDHVYDDSGCACARLPVREIKKYVCYELPTDQCCQTGAACGISDFLTERRADLERILKMLKALPAEERTDELSAAEKFIEGFLQDPSKVQSCNPCLKVGDLLIALESAGVSTFYTMNWKESRHLCRSMGQELIVRPNNPDEKDECCAGDAQQGPRF
jgi:predicted nucleic acid-binding protein